jgi:hypothetical protein
VLRDFGSCRRETRLTANASKEAAEIPVFRYEEGLSGSQNVPTSLVALTEAAEGSISGAHLWHARGMKAIGEDDSANECSGSPTDEDTLDALDRLSRQAFEAGLYDRNEMPEGGNDE